MPCACEIVPNEVARHHVHQAHERVQCEAQQARERLEQRLRHYRQLLTEGTQRMVRQVPNYFRTERPEPPPDPLKKLLVQQTRERLQEIHRLAPPDPLDIDAGSWVSRDAPEEQSDTRRSDYG